MLKAEHTTTVETTRHHVLRISMGEILKLLNLPEGARVEIVSPRTPASHEASTAIGRTCTLVARWSETTQETNKDATG